MRVKAPRLGWEGRVNRASQGCVVMLRQHSGRKGPSPQRRKSTKKYDQIGPSSSQASPTLWGNHCGSDNRDCHTHTTSQNHCAQAGRDTIGIWLCTRPRHRDCVDMPDAGLHPHREAKYKQHTHNQSNRAVCPSATHWQHEVRQGDTHDSGPAAIRVSPCQTSNAKFAMAQ